MEDSLLKLADAGLVGVMIALIMLSASTVFMLWKMACNHIAHTNDIFNKNTEALTKLNDAVGALTERIKES